MATTWRVVFVLTMVLCPASIARAWVSDLLVDELSLDEGSAGGYLGHSVSISGDMAIVGGFSEENTGVYSSSAYVFQNGPSGWTQVAKLLPEDDAPNDLFGKSVAIDGNTVVIGAPGSRNLDEPGSAYVFEGSGSGWTQVAKLVSTEDPDHYWPGYQFGYSVGISDGTVLVGAAYEFTNGKSGVAYVFEDEGDGWTQTLKLQADDGEGGDAFGQSVAISGDTAIVGAPGSGYDKKSGKDSKGELRDSAYIFQRDDSGWTQVASLTAGNAFWHDGFGRSVAIDGSRAIVGAPWEEQIGAAHIFEDDGSGWQAVDTLFPIEDTVEGNQFGVSVAISGDKALVTDSKDGAVYLFEKDESGWAETTRLLDYRGEDWYTLPVAIDGDTALVGNPSVSADPDFPGTVYVFAVPEPSSLLLLLTATSCLLLWRVRRR